MFDSQNVSSVARAEKFEELKNDHDSRCFLVKQQYAKLDRAISGDLLLLCELFGVGKARAR